MMVREHELPEHVREVALRHVAQTRNSIIQSLRHFGKLMQNHSCVRDKRFAHVLIEAVDGYIDLS